MSIGQPSLNLGEGLCLCSVYHFQDSGHHLLNSFFDGVTVKTSNSICGVITVNLSLQMYPLYVLFFICDSIYFELYQQCCPGVSNSCSGPGCSKLVS